ncbi:hypothetical protein SV7mr_04700 [Stieleria bergensis]|uniref:Uncharacterized protein n=1 Tax=Stieleria bergensis TaxID=2528025 RepID=A0A517SPD3_9BACT|nr:hypothetical protein SV7mr_04700 [Planctomycetes bacterium SV_7m_r]
MRQHSSTDLCGGRPETAVPTVTEVVGNANRRQPQQNPPRPAIETLDAAALQLCTLTSMPPAANRPTAGGDGVAARTVANTTTPRSTIRHLRERCSDLMKAVLLMYVLPGSAGGEQQVEMKLHRCDCKGMMKSQKKVIVCN